MNDVLGSASTGSGPTTAPSGSFEVSPQAASTSVDAMTRTQVLEVMDASVHTNPRANENRRRATRFLCRPAGGTIYTAPLLVQRNLALGAGLLLVGMFGGPETVRNAR